MLDKRDIRFTLESVKDNVRYIGMEFAEHASSVWDTIKVCVPSMVRDVKFLFDGTIAAGRRAEERNQSFGTWEERRLRALIRAQELSLANKDKPITVKVL